ncbi:hypothetical protein F959_01638 [Acinetobacter venetianus RAG-1 = CIP 110063]|uniref:Lysozyme inhibitor LprI-like N-terminal domain-containing protein n=1 Tax=Acinetobacter venetianus (strain ATCC 31012 / DSM 23050 / BCRC 14357 / CCUG 45561 / CIP 110063 / KCTC 2702 / LMG 19082 / RAG-1) TaxID=1191460 RepID=N8YJF1_ACIVR|nr:lysozyme inhibitor LprI family protein [Acinetobacter venetianus]ENV36831.1 hypothetical protein F959_01638 [Acinetobacter venetianus RAG-1 = CIP 110063]
MVKNIRYLMAGILLVGSTLSYANMDKCIKLNSQTELNKCATQSLSIVEGQIGRVYQKYLKELNDREQNQLRESQRLWVQFKEKDCAFEASPVKGGSMHSYVLSACLIDRTEKRITELENMMNCSNGTEPSCL